MDKLGRVGLIARFKPLHNGGALMLEAVCERAGHVVIGIGSCNKYNARNPFTADESKDMVDKFLTGRFSNYSFISVPDFGHIPKYSDGQMWREYIFNTYGELDHFVSGNDYVSELLKNNYDIIHPASLISRDKQVRLRATEVRIEMARFGNWKELVPENVAGYLESSGLVDRFRREFGLETLGEMFEGNYSERESVDQEKSHVGEI